MAFFINLNDRFKIDPSVAPDGAIILSGTIPMHRLSRRLRKQKVRPLHMKSLLFDPQLYMAGLDAAESREYCTKLATYPWFGAFGLDEYDSGEQTQASWKKLAEEQIHLLWPKTAPTHPDVIEEGVKECIRFQREIDCSAIILPSPLTIDRSTDYQLELLWLDTAIDYIGYLNELHDSSTFDTPVFATLAVSDVCVRHSAPEPNPLLDLVLDAVSAREIDGVYIILEQASETDRERQCGNTYALSSILHLVHVLSSDCNKRVVVNFLGPFGLACEAAGAEIWASGWYKSLYRCRLADKIAGGRAFPWFWSHPSAVDVSLDSDFDKIVRLGEFRTIADQTLASDNLLKAVSDGRPASSVPAWEYRQANVSAATQHFLLSCVQAEKALAQQDPAARRDHVEQWLNEAVENARVISETIGESSKTRTQHVQAWRDAFVEYRRSHRC